jgi:hypothetical protein
MTGFALQQPVHTHIRMHQCETTRNTKAEKKAGRITLYLPGGGTRKTNNTHNVQRGIPEREGDV